MVSMRICITCSSATGIYSPLLTSPKRGGTIAGRDGSLPVGLTLTHKLAHGRGMRRSGGTKFRQPARLRSPLLLVPSLRPVPRHPSGHEGGGNQPALPIPALAPHPHAPTTLWVKVSPVGEGWGGAAPSQMQLPRFSHEIMPKTVVRFGVNQLKTSVDINATGSG